MKGEITTDKDFIDAFNQGYILSKELGLKSDILKDLVAGNNRIQAMQEGMLQYESEITKEMDKDIIPPLDLDSVGDNYVDLDSDKGEKGKDMDMDL